MTNFEFCRDSIHSKTTESCLLLFLCTLGNKHKGGKLGPDQSSLNCPSTEQLQLVLGGDVVRPSAGAQSCPTLHLVLYSTNNSLLNWPTKCYPLCRAYLCEFLNWLPQLSVVEVSITFKHFLAQKSSRHDLFDCRSVKKARLRWRTNFDVPLDNLKVVLPSSTKSSSSGERDLFIKRLGLFLEETPHGCRLRWGEEAHFLALPFQGEQSRSFVTLRTKADRWKDWTKTWRKPRTPIRLLRNRYDSDHDVTCIRAINTKNYWK